MNVQRPGGKLIADEVQSFAVANGDVVEAVELGDGVDAAVEVGIQRRGCGIMATEDQAVGNDLYASS